MSDLATRPAPAPGLRALPGLLARGVARGAARGWRMTRRLRAASARAMPKGLYPRSLVIVVAPIVILQSVLAYVFMERHWQTVTTRLSAAVAQDVAAMVDLRRTLGPASGPMLERLAAERLGLDLDVLPPTPLPPPAPKPFFSLLDQSLAGELRKRLDRPFWLDTVGRSSFIEVRVQLDDATLRVMAHRAQAYASNSSIFLGWMLGTSVVLVVIAVLFLRNQIRPVQRLAEAAESFGKGREIEFRPRGAREVRAAGHAFIEMKRRIERVLSQRTTMLNGVSHDLRTVLTRFKLSLALLDDGPELDDLRRDVDEMAAMLEGYLAFARGDAGERPEPVDVRGFLDELRADAERGGQALTVEVRGDPVVTVRPQAFRRCLVNLVTNAARHGARVEVRALHEGRILTVTVDDDGPGIPSERRDEVFRPFVRLDEARQDAGGSGLGLTIARDVARAHGGEITLEDSALGGLRVVVRVPG